MTKNTERTEAIRSAKDMDARIEIVFAEDERTCDAVKRLDGQYFDPDEVPELPLPDCDAESCRCLYVPVFND